MVVEIISKGALRSTIPSQDTEARCDDAQVEVEEPHTTISSPAAEYQLNYAQGDVDNDCHPPCPATPAIERAREEEKGESTLIQKTSLPLAERMQHLNKSLEPDYHKLDRDFQLGRKRSSNGVLLTKSGKVDRRSSRRLGHQENQTPSRWSIAPETPAARLATDRLSDPFETPVLPSIEQSASGLEHGSNRQLQSDPSSRPIKSKDTKLFACGHCKKQYTSRQSLKYVESLHLLVLSEADNS